MPRQKKRTDGRLKSTFTFKGKRYYVYGRSQQELKANEAKRLAELKAGQEQRDNPTLSQYYERWSELRRGSVRGATMHSQISHFKGCAEVYIPSAQMTLGGMKLSEITADDIREVQRNLIATGRSSRTVNDYLAHLSHVFKTAVHERRIDYNPCVLIKPLKRIEEHARDTIHRYLTDAELDAFFKKAESSHYYNAFRLALNTGLRFGEIAALLPGDIRKNVIYVRRTVTRMEDGTYALGDEAKTRAGERRIPVNATIREILEHQKAFNDALFGDQVIDIHTPLFRAPRGGLMMSTQADRVILKICRELEIEPFTTHAFRDTFASRAIERGMNPKILQELLGHSDFGMTMNLYAHVSDTSKVSAMELMAK